MNHRMLVKVVSVALLSGVSVSGQSACPNIGDPGTKTASISLRTGDGACTLTSGGFVKSIAYPEPAYKLHFTTTVTGSCIARAQQCSGLPPVCGCINTATYLRNLGTTSLIDPLSNPISPHSVGAIAASTNVQFLDTAVPTGTASTGIPWSPTVVGEHTITSITGWNPTPCNLDPTTFTSDQPFTVHVMACKPEWFTGGTPTVNFQAPATGGITIVIPSGFEDARGPAEQAAADWSAALGRNVTVQAGYGTCAAGDPLCIQLKDDHGTLPGDPAGCASFGTATYDPSTGAWQGSTSVRFELNWKGGHPDNLRRTIAHELGHYFGLANRLHSSCSQSGTVMGATSCYASQAPPAGTALGPSASDVSALVNSTYGSHVRSICGW